jgi:hypothetical protein
MAATPWGRGHLASWDVPRRDRLLFGVEDLEIESSRVETNELRG